MKKYIALIFSVLVSVFALSQNAKFSIDAKLTDTDVVLSLLVENTSTVDSFGLGNSEFRIKVNNTYADLNQLSLVKQGRWSAVTQPTFFQNIEIGKVAGDTTFFIKVKPISSQLSEGNFPSIATYLYPTQKDTIAKVKIKLKSCFIKFPLGIDNLSNSNKWDISAPTGGTFNSINLQPDFFAPYTFSSNTFSSKISVQTCETVDYTATNTNGWATQKEWFNNAGASMGFGNSKTFTTSGNYRAVLKNASQAGCTIIDSILYTKILLPNPTLVSDSVLCKGATMDVKASSLGDSIFVTSNVSGFGKLKAKDLISFTVGNGALGSYFFSFKNSQCTVLDTVKVSRTTLIADARIISGTIKKDTSCFAKAVGLSASLTTGGKLPYQYTWIKSNASDVLSDQSAFKTDVIAANSGKNKFFVEIKDANNCVSKDSIEIFQNNGIVVNMVDPADTVMLCVSPTAFTDYSVTPTGGKQFTSGTPYKYKWNIEKPALLILGTGTDTTFKTRMITQNKEGNTYLYTTVTDALGCTAKDSVFLRLRYYSSEIKKQYDPICPDLNDTLTVTVNGGSGNYDVTWFSGDIFFIDKNRAIFKQMVPGSYEIDVLVTDNGNGNGFVGCIARTKVPLEVKQLNPQFIDFAGFTKSLNYVCFNDQLYLDASVSTGLYGSLNYVWNSTINNGETFVGPADSLSKIVKMVGGTPGTTSELLLKITDSIGCKASTKTNIFWNTDVLVAGVQDTVFVCDGGQGNLKLTNPTGGTGSSYTYKWNIVNSGSTNASFVSSNTTQEVTIKLDLNVPYDTVYVTGTATDAVGCFKTHNFVMIGTKLQLQTSVLDSVQCATIENLLQVSLLSPGNEFGSYQYKWTASGSSSILGTDDSLLVFTKNGLNVYNVDVLDLKTSCSSNASISFTGENLASAIISSTHTSPFVICNGDDIELNGLNSTGGTAVSAFQKYHYSWREINSNLTTISPIDTVGKVNLTYIPTTKIDTIFYELKIADKRGCVDSVKTTVVWNTQVKPEINDSLYSCVPSAITLELTDLTGGFSPYSYNWISDKGFSITDANSASASVLLAKSDSTKITLTVKDRFNCLGTVSAMATGILFKSNISANQLKACAEFSDTLEIAPAGDFIGPFTYNWTPSNLLNDPTVYNPIAKITQPTTFSAEITDTKTGCKTTNSIDLKFYDFKVSISGDTVMCIEDLNTVLTANPIVVGEYPVSYTWTSSDSNIDLLPNSGNTSTITQIVNSRPVISTIKVEMKDSIGCKTTDITQVLWNTEILVTGIQDTVFVCDGGQGNLKLSNPTGGSGSGYSYSWEIVNSGSTNASFVSSTSNQEVTISLDLNTPYDTVYVKGTVFDAVGCSKSHDFVMIGTKLQLLTTVLDSVQCEGIENILYVSLLSPGNEFGSYEYEWTKFGSSTTLGFSDSLLVLTENGLNEYTIEVKDLKTSCSASKSVSFEGQNLASAIISSSHTNPFLICYGESIELSGVNSTGGTALSAFQKYHYTWKELNSTLTSISPNDTVGKVMLTYFPTSVIDTLYYELKIADKRGCVDSVKTSVVWNTKVKPEINDSLYACVPNAIALEITTLEGGFLPYTYNWVSDKGFAITNKDAASASVSLTKTDSTIITLTVKDKFNCSGSASAMAAGILFDSKILAHHPKSCENFADTLEILPSGDFIGPFTYNWSPSNLLSDPTIYNPIARISQPTTFTAEIIDTKTGCKTSNSIEVKFYEFEVSISGDTIMCFEDLNTVLTANPIIVGDYPVSYKWSSVDTNLDFILASNNQITAIQKTKTRPVFPKIVVEMFDSIGCKAYDTINTIWNDSIQVKVLNSKPSYIHPVTFDEYHFMCLGNTYAVQSSVKNGKLPYSYDWSLNQQNGFELKGINTDPVNSIFVNSAENKDTLHLKITDALGCSNIGTYSLDARKLNVDLISSKDSLCPNTDFELKANPSFDFKEGLLSSNVTYSFDNKITFGIENTKQEVADLKELFTVYAYDSITTCRAFDSVRVKIESIKINLVSTFSVVGETNTKICFGDQAFIDASTSKGGQKPYEFTWSKNDTLNIVANVAKTEVLFDSLEIGVDKFITYNLKIRDQFGCQNDTAVIFRMNKKMEAFTNPLNIDTLIGCVGQPIEVGSLIDSLVAKGGTGQYTYYWTNHDIPHYDLRPWTKNQGFITKRATTLAPYPILKYTLTVSDKALPHCKAVDVGWAKYVDRPYPNFSGGADTIGSCKVLSEPLIAGVDTLYGQYPTIQWYYNKDMWPSKGDSIPASQGGTRDTLRAVNEGHYIIKVIDKVYNCISYDSSFVNQDSLPDIIIHADPIICDNKRLKLWAEFIPEFDPFSSKITWSISTPNSGVNTSLKDSVLYYSPTRLDSSITFKAVFSNFCAANSDSVKLKFQKAPFAALKTSNIYINPQETVLYQNLSKGSNLESNWEIHSAVNDVNIYNLTNPPFAILYPEEGIFETILYIQDTSSKCTDTANVFINVEVNRIIYIPNVLSTQAENPENRVIKVYAEGVVAEDFSFSIFDRWGQRIFHTTDFNSANTLGWDGVSQKTGMVEDMGVFTYTLNCKYLDGRKLKKQGTITLIK